MIRNSWHKINIKQNAINYKLSELFRSLRLCLEGLRPPVDCKNLSFNEMAESELEDRRLLMLVDNLWLLELLQADTVIQSNSILSIHDWFYPREM